MLKNNRNAIALLVTLAFIMVVSVLVGIGLGHVKQISKDMEQEKFLLQTGVILDDVMQILKNTKEIDAMLDANSSEGFYTFVQQSAYIPINTEEIEVVLEIASARGKINLNTLKDTNTTFRIQRVEALQQFLSAAMVDMSYADLLLDTLYTPGDDVYYATDMFTYNPNLFRGYIASKKHLLQINEFFKNRYRYNTLTNIDFDDLFYYTKDNKTKIDLNFATPSTWMFLLGCDKIRAEQIHMLGGVCTNLECFELNEQEKELLGRFDYSFYEKVIAVKVTMYQNDMRAKIAFEYDLKSKKGSNFVYEIS